MAPVPTFAQRLEQRMAQLPHNTQENDEPLPDPAPTGRRRRRRRRQVTETQLRERREKAVAKERKYEKRVAKAEGFARKKRFTHHKQIAVFCGVTSAAAKQGPGLEVFIAQNVLGNHHYKSRGVDGRMRWVGHNQVRYANNFGSEQAKQAATCRYQQARALEAMENAGFLTKAEADMASRHPDAWEVAVKLAKEKGMYSGDDVDGFNNQQKADQQAANGLFVRLVDIYEVDVSAEGICHAANFFCSHRYDFPEGFGSEHLDLFLVTYAIAMVYHPDPRRNLARVGCVERLRHGNRRQITQIMDLARESMESAAGLEAYDQAVITVGNVGVLRSLSPVAHADALPPALDFRSRQSENRAAWTALQATNAPGLATGLLYRYETANKFIGQTSFSIPSDFSNWDEWFPYFFPDRESIPSIPYNCIPRIGVSARGALAGDAAIKLRVYQLFLKPHCNDVVVFFVWEAIRRAAAAGDYVEMDDLFADVKRMIRGREPYEADQPEPDSDSEEDDEEEIVDDGFDVFRDDEPSEDDEDQSYAPPDDDQGGAAGDDD